MTDKKKGENVIPLNTTGKVKKEETPKQQKEDVQIDPNVFGYREGQRIEVDANMFMSFISFAHQVSLQERKIFYEPNDNFDKTLSSGKEVLTDLGLQGVRWMELITNTHIDNIKKGVAVHQDVLMKEVTPSFEVDSVEKE
ncbi:MAG: hypothetical protein KC414_08045 [Romboutsia sp.]|nr:hypothetical protein [Romboutsia sp.]